MPPANRSSHVSVTAVARAAALVFLAMLAWGATAAPPRAPAPASLAARLDATVKQAPAPQAGRCVSVTYEGLLELEAHFRKPGEKHTYHSRHRYVADGVGSARMEWTTWLEGDSIGAPETWLYARGILLYREAPGRRWVAVSAARRDQLLTQTLAGLPWEIAREMKRGLAAGILRGTGGDPSGLWTVSDGKSPAASALTIGPIDNRIVSYVTNRPHPRLGDVRDGVVYAYAEPGPVPTEIREVVHERDQQWALTERRVDLHTDSAEESLLALPASFEPAPADEDSLRSEPILSSLAPGLWAVNMDDIDSRSMIVEFADHLAVLEAAVGSANGERIVDLARRQWPRKPIRWFLFSHYHPHYAGGVRAFVAEGATIVTTPGNEAMVRQAASWPFRLKPDRLARAAKPLQIQTFQKRFELADSTNRLVAVDIGARSDHTNEFVVFWFPRQRILFETEQGWVTVEGKPRAIRRAEKFLKTLDEEGLTADLLVQSWPMRGNAAQLTRAVLDSLVLARKR